MRPVDARWPITLGYRERMASRPGYVHRGEDYGCPTGTPVRATASGTVVYVGQGGGNGPACGLHIIVRTSSGIYCAYYHLSRADTAGGRTVVTGQQLGLSGATGNVTGPHLHYQEQTEAPGWSGHDANGSTIYAYQTDRAPQFNKETVMPTDPYLKIADSALGFAAHRWTVKDCDQFIAAVKAAGFNGVAVYRSALRYNPAVVAKYGDKCMPTWAVIRCMNAGLIITTVYEDTTGNPLGGAAQGHKDAAEYIRQLREDNAQPGMVAYVAFDRPGFTFALGTPEREYALAVAADLRAAGFIPGCYGNRAVCDSRIFDCMWLVQTWTKTGLGGVHMVQLVDDPRILTVAGYRTDTNLVLHNFTCLTRVTKPAPNTLSADAVTAIHNAQSWLTRANTIIPTGNPARGVISNAFNALKGIAA